VSRKQALTRGFPNGETHTGKTGIRPDEFIVGFERTQGSEPSQYLKEKKETSIAKVVASEIATAQTQWISVQWGL
jgi:virulence-associated protein VapD